jgi:hypothetical protein
MNTTAFSFLIRGNTLEQVVQLVNSGKLEAGL